MRWAAVLGSAALVLVTAEALASSAPAQRAAAFMPSPTSAAWRDARAEIARLRASAPTSPHITTVRVAFRGPGGIGFDGRGAIAVAPGRALRMILLGPGGRTALDVWATPERYRLAVPDLGIVERGAGAAPPHLPLELFREWFLAPLEGRLLAAGTRGERAIYIVRGARLTLELGVERHAGAPTVHTLETAAGGRTERVTWLGPPGRTTLVPGIGERVVFAQPASGLDVPVEVEAYGTEPPSPEAFDEPTDAPEARP